MVVVGGACGGGVGVGVVVVVVCVVSVVFVVISYAPIFGWTLPDQSDVAMTLFPRDLICGWVYEYATAIVIFEHPNDSTTSIGVERAERHIVVIQQAPRGQTSFAVFRITASNIEDHQRSSTWTGHDRSSVSPDVVNIASAVLDQQLKRLLFRLCRTFGRHDFVRNLVQRIERPY